MTTTSSTDNAATLRALLVDYDLTRQKAADMLDVRKSTVDSWLAGPEKEWARAMPDRMLRLLRLQLRGRRRKG